MTKVKKKSNDNSKIVIISLSIVIVILVGIIIYLLTHPLTELVLPIEKDDYKIFEHANAKVLESYSEYERLDGEVNIKITEEDFKNNKYILVSYTTDGCSEKMENITYKTENGILNIYYDVELRCGLCAPYTAYDLIKVDKKDIKDTINVYYKNLNVLDCGMVAYKPMIYVYPEKDMDLTIKLGHKELLTSTYPKYKNSWNVRVSKDGNIYDYDTKRNYYGLYWEAKDNTKLDMSEGFVVKGEDTVKFLEEKLAYVGLEEKEINEFIVYWINKLDNNYNFFRFRTIEEINEYMPLYISSKPDTLIRVLIDFVPLDEYVSVKEQTLTKVERKGYTVVEWGMTPHYNK